jgi:hypothetical protein
MVGLRVGAAVLALGLVVVAAPVVASAPPASSPRRHQVIDTLVVPTNASQAAQLAFNLDGDPGATPDNTLGLAFGPIMALVFGDSPQDSADAGISSGRTLNLVSIAADSLRTDPTAWWRGFIARSKADPVLTGGGRFKVDATAPSGTWLKGSITNRRITARSGTVPLRLAILPTGDPLTVRLLAVRVKARCTVTGCTGGILGGGVPYDELRWALVPLVAESARSFVRTGCPLGWRDIADCDQTAQTVLGVFDKAPLDREINETEVEAVLAPFLAPDLDLFGADGKRGTDGVDESVSFGIGFTTKPAIFAEP